MIILFVSNFPIDPNRGGVQRMTSVLAEEFTKLGHNTFCLVLEKNNSITLTNGRLKHFFLPEQNLYNKKNTIFFVNLLNKLQVDIIINQTGVERKIVDFLNNGRKKYNFKLFTVHHNCIKCLVDNYWNIVSGSSYGKILKLIGSDILRSFLLFKIKHKQADYFNNAIEKSDKLVLLSEIYIHELKTYLNRWNNEKVVAIPCPIPFDIKQNDLNKKENRLIYVGRIEYAQKQAHLLIPIWKSISKRFPDWELDIIGDGSYLNQLKMESDKENLSRIHFHGYSDPRPFLEKAKILLMTSCFEGFSMVLIEAQAYGVVPIAFNSFPTLEFILMNFEAGIGVTPFSIDEYTEKLQDLILDNQKLELMASNGYLSAARFLPSKIVRYWLNLF